MDIWKSEIRAFCKAENLDVYESALGLGLEFRDGCDAFWILPGEVMSSIACAVDDVPTVKEILDIYESTDRVRSDVLKVIRYFHSERKQVGDLSRTGEWGWSRGGGYSEFDVGSQLTRAILRGLSLDEILMRFWYVDGKKLSKRRLERYLSAPMPPPTERLVEAGAKWPDRDEADDTSTIIDTINYMVACDMLMNAAPEKVERLLKNTEAPGGRIAEVIRRVGNRLPTLSASCDLLTPGTIDIEFEDGLDCYSIELRSQEFVKSIEGRDLAEAADDIAADIRRLNDRRSAVLNAIWAAAAERGWSKHVLLGGVFESDPTIVRLGIEHELLSFEAGKRLTNRLRRSGPRAAILKILKIDLEFAEQCCACLERGSRLTDPLPEKQLPPRVDPALDGRVELVEVTPERIAAMDAFADEALARFFAQDDVHRNYCDRRYYDPTIDDDWLDDQWVDAARRSIEKSKSEAWVDPSALQALIDAGEPNLEPLLARYFNALQKAITYEGGEAFIHYECISEIDVPLIWKHRHAYPNIANAVLGEVWDEYVDVRARLGDPTAERIRRFKKIDVRVALEDEDWDLLKDATLLNQHERELVARHILNWAAKTAWVSPPDSRLMAIALSLQLSEFCTVLEQNPYLLKGLFTNDPNLEPMEEPGLLCGSEFLLIWSRLAPSDFLMRFILTAGETDLVADACAAAVRKFEERTDSPNPMLYTSQVYTSFGESLVFHMGIAWKRCRQSLHYAC